MAPAALPLLPIRRVLIPGTGATLPAFLRPVARGEEVVAVFSASGRRVSAGVVGTRAVAEAVRVLGPELRLLHLRGICLVRLLAAPEEQSRQRAHVVEIPEPGRGSPELAAAVERALVRYLALRAEAGEEVGPPVKLPRDPVRASHEVASRLRISWPEVQDILEAGTAADRLRREWAVLDKEAELLQRLLGREGA